MRKFSDIITSYKPAEMLNESKKTDKINIVFLSAKAGHTIKPSNSMFIFKQKCEERGMIFTLIDPSKATIKKVDSNIYKIIEYSDDEIVEIELNRLNTIIVPRRTVLKNSESKAIMTKLQNAGFFCFNTLSSYESCEDKFLTGQLLDKFGVPTPRTEIVAKSSLSKLEEKVKNIGGQFPIVCKILDGTQGIGVFIAESMMSLKSTLQTMFALSPGSDIILQEMIDSDYDLRIHVLFDGFETYNYNNDSFRIIGCMKRNKLDGDFRSNYSLGSTAEKGELTEEQKQIAINAAKATGCRWCGVDLIIDKRSNQPYVIEVNSSPGTKGITTAAGDDVVGIIMDMFKNFEYTELNAKIIGKYESISNNTLGINDVIMFDSAKQLTEMQCSSISIDENTGTVSFVYNGGTYNLPVVGLRNGNPLVDMIFKFNGKKYNDELVVLVESADNNYIIGGSKFLSRIGIETISQESWILTDNITNFTVPQQITEEENN